MLHPPQSELAVQIESVKAPNETTAARIQPLIVTVEKIRSSAVPINRTFQCMIVARTVCYWSASDKTAVVHIANASHKHIYFKWITLHGHIAPVSVALDNTASAIQTDSRTIASTHNELRAAQPKTFDKSTFTPGDSAQVLEISTKYRSDIPQLPQELDKCTLAEEHLFLNLELDQ